MMRRLSWPIGRSACAHLHGCFERAPEWLFTCLEGGSDQATCAPSGTGNNAPPRPPQSNEVSVRGGNDGGGGGGGDGDDGDGDGGGGASNIGGGSGGSGGRGGGAGIGASYHGATRDDGDHASKRARGASPPVSSRNTADGGVGFGDARKQASATREALQPPPYLVPLGPFSPPLSPPLSPLILFLILLLPLRIALCLTQPCAF